MRIDPIRRSTLGEAEHAEAEIKSVRQAVRCIHPLTCGHTGGHARLKPLRFHRPRPRLTRCQAKPSQAGLLLRLRCAAWLQCATLWANRNVLSLRSTANRCLLTVSVVTAARCVARCCACCSGSAAASRPSSTYGILIRFSRRESQAVKLCFAQYTQW